MARWLAIAIMVAHAATADADATVRLTSTGERCSVETLPARVAAVLGRDPFDATARMVVRVDLENAGRFVARVTFEDGDRRRGPRSIEAADCDALLDSIALVIAMGVTAAPASASAPTIFVAPVSEPPADMLELEETIDPEHDRGAREFAASVAGAAGVSANGWHEQLVVGLRLRSARHAFAVELRRSAPERRDAGAVGSLAVTTTTGSGVACRMVGIVGLCGAVTAGVVHGEGVGLYDARSVTSPVLGLGGRVGLEHELWRGLRARVELGVDGLVTKSRFDIDHMPVWTSSTFDAWAGAGVLARFL